MNISNNDGINIDNLNNFKEIISIPTITNSYITKISSNSNNNENENNNLLITIALSQTDYKNKKNKISNCEKILLENETIISIPFLKESNSLFSSVSPKFKKLITIKETTFEIYDNNNKLITSIKWNLQIKRLLIDDWFGNISWSPCENFIVFIGEINKNYNNLGFFNDSDNSSTKINENIGDEFLYRENFGENYSNVTNPTIFIIDINKEILYPIDSFPSDKITPGQPIWTPCGCGMVFVGWEIDKRKYGLNLCFNRISSIYHLDFKLYKDNRERNNGSGNIPILIENLLINSPIGSYRSPRFTNDGKNLIFLGFDEIIFNHNSCSKIFKIKWNDKRVENPETLLMETLLDYRNYNDEFTGIYCSKFQSKCFLKNDQNIIFSNSIRSINKLISFNIETKQIVILKTEGILDSKEFPKNYYIYQVFDNMVLCKSSSPNEPPSINLLYLNNQGTEIIKSIEIYKYSLSKKQLELLSTISYSIHKVPTLYNAKVLKSFEMIYLKSGYSTNTENGKGKKPTILYIHGGFHMNIDLEYSFSFAYLVSLGYNIIIPNYRGSTGFGLDFLNSLVGEISRMDVDDCIQSISYSIEKVDPNGIDPDRISTLAGSHGGSIALILSSLEINCKKIKTSILRNPVVDIASSSLTSDIPDWCLFKCGIKPLLNENISKKPFYPTIPTLKEIELMKNLSPIKHIDNIKNVPILLLLGDNDLRVPPQTQGIQLYNSLKERNEIIKCLIYQRNGHSLDSIDSKLDQWLNISIWLNKYS